MLAKVSMLDIVPRQSMELVPAPRVIQIKPRSCQVWRVNADGTQTRLGRTTICLTSKTVKIGDINHLIG